MEIPANANIILNFNEMHQNDNVFGFIMGFNDNFEYVRSQIIMMQPTSPLDKVSSIILQEERQRLARIGNVSSECTIAVVQHNKRKNEGGLSKYDIRCDFCKKTGHPKSKCYAKHGFPPDFKFTKNKYSNNEGA